jgi:hypothetical protein
MLSPNASIRLAVRRGAGGDTVTGNWQLAVRATLSVAVQVTWVVPTGNRDPLAGEHETDTGEIPPDVTGAANAMFAP